MRLSDALGGVLLGANLGIVIARLILGSLEPHHWLNVGAVIIIAATLAKKEAL